MQPVPFDIDDDEGDSDSDLDVRISGTSAPSLIPLPSSSSLCSSADGSIVTIERIRQTNHRPSTTTGNGSQDQDPLSSGDEAPLSRMNRRLKTSQNYITSFGSARLEARRERLERAARMIELDQAECNGGGGGGQDDYYGGVGGGGVEKSERRRKRTFFRNPTTTLGRIGVPPGSRTGGAGNAFEMLRGPDPRLEALGVGEGPGEYYEGPGKEMVAKEWEDGY